MALIGCTSPEELEQQLLGHWQRIENDTTVCTSFMEEGKAQSVTQVVEPTRKIASAETGSAEKEGVAVATQNAEKAVTYTYEDGSWAAAEGMRFRLRLSVAYSPEGYFIPHKGRSEVTEAYIITEITGDQFTAINGKFKTTKIYTNTRVDDCPFLKTADEQPVAVP